MNINNEQIGIRLKKIRSTLGFSQLKFAERTNIHQTIISDIENGKTNLSYNTIISLMTSIENINLDWLFTGRGDMFYSEGDKNKKSSFGTPNSVHLIDDLVHLNRNDKTKGIITSKSLQVTDDLLQLNSVQSKNNLLVPVAAYGGYLGEWTQEYISQDLVYIKIPGEPHQARTFEVSGDSMEPVISDGDYVVCRRCDQLNNIKIGRIYVIISALYGISVKYIYHGTGYIVMEPANLTSHQATLLDYADIKEIWEVVLRVTGDIKTTEDEPVRTRIATIEHYLYKQNPKWKGI